MRRDPIRQPLAPRCLGVAALPGPVFHRRSLLWRSLPVLASDLVRRGVSVFVATGGTGSVVNARPMVPHTIPIVFRLW